MTVWYCEEIAKTKRANSKKYEIQSFHGNYQQG